MHPFTLPYFVTWIPVNMQVCSNKAQPCLKSIYSKIITEINLFETLIAIWAVFRIWSESWAVSRAFVSQTRFVEFVLAEGH